ncbi:hypothetical protein evm_008983 [Chilo suppressalis]|nr:hypothetical protein evm_008983 [Chilo suppressalis]
MPDWTFHFKTLHEKLGHPPMRDRTDKVRCVFPPADGEEYRLIQAYLSELEKVQPELSWYSYALPEERSLKVAIRDLPFHTEPLHIKDALAAKGFTVEHTKRIRARAGRPGCYIFRGHCGNARTNTSHLPKFASPPGLCALRESHTQPPIAPARHRSSYLRKLQSGPHPGKPIPTARYTRRRLLFVAPLTVGLKRSFVFLFYGKYILKIKNFTEFNLFSAEFFEMCDIEEPPTKMSKFDEMSQTYTQEEDVEEGQEEAQEEWLSEEMLTDEDGNTTIEQDPSDSAVGNNTQVSQDNTNLSSNDTSSKLDHSQIEEALNNMDSEQDDLPDVLNTFLVMKKGNKTESKPVAQEESDGNDTDDLLRMLEDDVKKTTKKVKVVSAKDKEDKKKAEQETSSDDEDDFVFEGASVQQLRIAHSVLMKKLPASKAVPEDSSNDDDDEDSTDKPVVRRVKFARKSGNYAAKSTSKPQKPQSPINKQRVRITRSASNASRTQTPTQTSKTPTQISKTPTQTSKTPTQTSKTSTQTSKTPTPTSKTPTQTPKNTPIGNNKTTTLKSKNELANETAKKTILTFGNNVTLKMNTSSPVQQYTNKNLKKPILKSSPAPKPVDKPVAKPVEQPVVKQLNKPAIIKRVVINKNVTEKSETLKVAKPAVRLESEEIINEDEFLEDDDFDLDEEFADESDTELDKRAIKQRIMRPEQLDEEMFSDGDSMSEEESLFDDLPSSDSDLDDWFTLDIRDERAGDYLPLLGSPRWAADYKLHGTPLTSTFKFDFCEGEGEPDHST